MSLSYEEISARVEIEDVLTRYCYALDERNWDAYRVLFTEDAVLDDRVTGGIRSGVEEHVQYLTQALAKVHQSQHAVSTILFDVNGDHANVRTHCSCPMVLDIGGDKPHVFFQGLWYRNTLVHTHEGWKISHLVEEGYWTYNIPPHFSF